MPQIDLDPSDYAKRDPKTGRWNRPISKRAAMVFCLISLAIVAWLFWTRHDGSIDLLFWATAMFSFCAGVFAAYWLRDVY